jgi:hypothetical protein
MRCVSVLPHTCSRRAQTIIVRLLHSLLKKIQEWILVTGRVASGVIEIKRKASRGNGQKLAIRLLVRLAPFF